VAWLSLRAYAKHRGCSLSAVQKALASGRLKTSTALDGKGQRKITDAALADAEWTATTHADRVPLAVQLRRAAAEAPATTPAPPPEGEESESGVPERAVSVARREAAEAALAELKLAKLEGEVIPAQDVESRLADLFTHCKTRLLGVPTRVRQEDPTLTAGQVATIEAVIREALADLAAEGNPAAAETAA
jgi:phage terminase Nu1 subunit (DNA packaging protein)